MLLPDMRLERVLLRTRCTSGLRTYSRTGGRRFSATSIPCSTYWRRTCKAAGGLSLHSTFRRSGSTVSPPYLTGAGRSRIMP